jgi:hypothetical protein
MFRIFPLLLIPIVIYAIVAGGNGLVGHDVMEAFLRKTLVPFHMFSGDQWDFAVGDLFILLGLGMLFMEVIKATRTTRRELLNHGLSAVVFVIALILFITTRGFSTSVFFFITVMTAIDVVGGYTISIVAAEHDLGMGKAGTD